jgi:iron complex outermembrane recepter protein
MYPILVAVLFLAGQAANAQLPVQVDDEKILDAIIVSATREATLDAKTSVSVEKIDGEDLQRRGVLRASQLANESASVTYRAIFGASAPQFFIRGIGNNDINPNANPGIAVYLGDSFVASPLAQNLLLFDLESAEVLKGPQGTLFGRNATGGALVFNPRKPGAERGANAMLEVDNFGLRATEFAADSGQMGAIAARFAANARESDGFVRNTLTGGHENDEEANAGRVSVVFQGEQALRGSLMLDWTRNRAGMRAHQGLGLLEPAGFANPSAPTLIPCAIERVLAGTCVNLLGYRYTSDPYSEGYDRNDREHVDSHGLSLVFDLDAEVRFRAITSYRKAARDVREDTDASPLNIVALDFINDSEALSQELRWGRDFAHGKWQLGFFGLAEKLETLNRFDTLGGLRALGVPFIADPAQFFRGPFRLDQRYTQRTRSFAAFAEADWALGARWIATTGLRLTRESNRFGTETRFNEVINQPILSPLRESANTDSAASWRTALRYQFSDHQSIYVSANRAFKSGYFNGGALFPFDAIGPVAPEFLNAFETGAKWRFMPNFETQVTAFYYRYNGLQDFTLRPSPPPTRQVLDSADAHVKGIEVNARALLPHGFKARLAYTFLDTQFVDFLDANGVDRSGNRLTASPRHTALAGLDWQGESSSNWRWDAGIQLHARSLIYFDNTNSVLLASAGRTLLHGSVGLSRIDTGTTLRLTVRNVGDRKVLLDALNLAEYGFLQQTYDSPRQIAVSLSQSF